MRAERVILSFVAVIIGLLAAGAAFYFYQSTKIPDTQTKPFNTAVNTSPTSTPDNENILTVDSPKDEEVFDKKVITISGKTRNDATIIVSSENTDQVVKPAANGNFSITQTILNGTTIIYITAVFPNGEEKTVVRTITFSTENF